MRAAIHSSITLGRSKPTEAQIRAGVGMGLLTVILGTQLMWSLLA